MRVNIPDKDMSEADYKEFRKLLYDYGEFDRIALGSRARGTDAKLKSMKEALTRFMEEHGEASIYLAKDNKDYSAFVMIWLYDEYDDVKVTHTVKNGKEVTVIG